MANLISPKRYHFRGAALPTAFASAVANGGTVTMDDGAVKLTAPAQAGVATAAIHFGGHLAFDIDKLVRVEFLAKFSTTVNPSSIFGLGVCSAYNATLDSITEQAMFRVEGDDDLLAETDDGTNDNNDIELGQKVTDDYMRLAIDFATGIQSKSPPFKSTGGKSSVEFFAGNSNRHLGRLGRNTGFDMSNYSSGQQLFAHAEKTVADALESALWIREICVTCKDN